MVKGMSRLMFWCVMLLVLLAMAPPQTVMPVMAIAAAVIVMLVLTPATVNGTTSLMFQAISMCGPEGM
jgi:hypothetical protein